MLVWRKHLHSGRPSIRTTFASMCTAYNNHRIHLVEPNSLAHSCWLHVGISTCDLPASPCGDMKIAPATLHFWWTTPLSARHRHDMDASKRIQTNVLVFLTSLRISFGMSRSETTPAVPLFMEKSSRRPARAFAFSPVNWPLLQQLPVAKLFLLPRRHVSAV